MAQVVGLRFTFFEIVVLNSRCAEIGAGVASDPENRSTQDLSGFSSRGSATSGTLRKPRD